MEIVLILISVILACTGVIGSGAFWIGIFVAFILFCIGLATIIKNK